MFLFRFIAPVMRCLLSLFALNLFSHHVHREARHSRDFQFLPRSTLVIDNPRRGDRIMRKQIDELRNFMKLRVSRSSDELLIAAAFRSISDERHDEVDELLESRRSFFRQMQLRNIVSIASCFNLIFNYFVHFSIPSVCSYKIQH